MDAITHIVRDIAPPRREQVAALIRKETSRVFNSPRESLIVSIPIPGSGEILIVRWANPFFMVRGGVIGATFPMAALPLVAGLRSADDLPSSRPPSMPLPLYLFLSRGVPPDALKYTGGRA